MGFQSQQNLTIRERMNSPPRRSFDMENVKRLRLMFYLLATLELFLLSGYYGWEHLLLR